MAPRQNPAPRCCNTPNGAERVYAVDRLCAFERATLQVARCFFQTFAHPNGQTWMQSFDTAHRGFDHGDPAQYVLRVLKVVQAMRIARSSTFCFSSPHCATCAPRLSEGEKHLTSALECVRLGQRSAAHIHGLLLTEGNDPGQMLQEMQCLCTYASQSSQTADPLMSGAAACA